MDRRDDARLVERVRGGDATAFAPLFERWYDRVFDVARGVVRNPELAADVAQDTFVAAWQQLDRLDDVEAFGGWLLRIARHKSLDAIRRESRSRPTGAETVSAMQDRGMAAPTSASRVAAPVDFVEANEDQALVWAAAAALGERDASVLDLHLRHGLTPSELADDLGVTANHAHQLMHRMRSRLEDAVGAFLLWRDGAKQCAGLRAVAAPVFDARTAASVRKHERSCPTCQDGRRRRTSPVALFSAAPIMSAPLIFRARAAQALATEGAPMRPELLEMAGDDPFGMAGGIDRSAGDARSDATDGSGGATSDAPDAPAPPDPDPTPVADRRDPLAFDDAPGDGSRIGDDDLWVAHPDDPTALLLADAGRDAGRDGGRDVGVGHADEADDTPPTAGAVAGAAAVSDPWAGPPRRDRRRVLALVGTVVVAVLAVGGLVLLLGDRSDGDAALSGGDGAAAGAPPSPPLLDPADDVAERTQPVIESTTTSTTPTVVPLTPAPPTSGAVVVELPEPTDPPTTPAPPPETPAPGTPAPTAPPPPPPTEPPPPAPTTTVAPPPTTTAAPATTTTTTPPRPVIWAFSIARGGQSCATPSAGASYEVAWSTEHANTVSLAWPSGSQGVGPSGTQAVCLPSGDQVTLTASSASGTATSTVTAP